MVWDCVMLIKGWMGVGCWVLGVCGLEGGNTWVGGKLNVGEFSGMMSWEGARGGLGVWN